MAEIHRHEITWVLTPRAQKELKALDLSPALYERNKLNMQLALCEYFNGNDCLRKSANIAPVKTALPNCKGLKMRWMLPGHGKSGGLRLAIAAYCDERRVVLCASFARKDDPGDSEFTEAFSQESQEAASGQ